jgi:hypothetical protein
MYPYPDSVLAPMQAKFQKLQLGWAPGRAFFPVHFQYNDDRGRPGLNVMNGHNEEEKPRSRISRRRFLLENFSFFSFFDLAVKNS